MLRTELFKQMKTWSSEDIKTFLLLVLFPMKMERGVDAVFAVADNDEINVGLKKMGRSERITK